ncbi:DUF3134 domain-containing protein [Leptothermofonsia sp. ETS-13]|uniref:DUF3134 domain-containing protein n=1 Tax=Leptothermofonsia sp. ETS-13 TaxID=3035696 RepID=UPI003B9E31B8
MTYNPSLREEPRNQRAAVIPLKQESSILDWLESSGRLLAREGNEFDYLEEEGEDISDLMGGDDGSFDLDDDDDDLELED